MKETLIKLTKYQDSVKSRLSDKTPEKHKHAPKEYKQFLERELASVSAKIDTIKVGMPAEGKK